MEFDVRLGNLAEASRTASKLCGYHSLLGDLERAIQYGRRGVILADQSGNRGQRIRRRASLADVLHQCGDFNEASQLFGEAEQVMKDAKGRSFSLKSFAGHQCCDLLISMKFLDEAEALAKSVVRMAKKDGAPFEAGVGLLDLSYICLIRCETPNSAYFCKAKELLEEAERYLMFASREDYYPRLLIVRAEFLWVTGKISDAIMDLTKAEAIASRAGMQLYSVDANLLRARITKSRSALSGVRALMERLGYWRHREALERLEQDSGNWP